MSDDHDHFDLPSFLIAVATSFALLALWQYVGYAQGNQAPPRRVEKKGAEPARGRSATCAT